MQGGYAYARVGTDEDSHNCKLFIVKHLSPCSRQCHMVDFCGTDERECHMKVPLTPDPSPSGRGVTVSLARASGLC